MGTVDFDKTWNFEFTIKRFAYLHVKQNGFLNNKLTLTLRNPVFIKLEIETRPKVCSTSLHLILNCVTYVYSDATIMW